MTELQNELLNMFTFFHNLCREEGLRYYALGGTALGAARHGGFIPWDDDIDVGMPRPDYERLKALRLVLDTGKYKFEYPNEHKDYVYPYGKMYDTTTTLVENTRYKTKRGIYIDIFPLDGAGNTYEESVTRFRKIDRIVNLICTQTCALRKGRKHYKNLAIILMRCIPNRLLGQSQLMESFDKGCKELSFDDHNYVANYAGNWHEKEISNKEWFEEPTFCSFHDITICCPTNLNAYLTALYGDWRTPPPPEKQITHHDFLMLDLNLSYLEN